MEFELILNKSKYRVHIEPGEANVRKIWINDMNFDVESITAMPEGAGEQKVKINGNDYKLEMLKHKVELGRAQFEMRVNDKYVSLEALMPQVRAQEFLQDSSDNIAAKAVPKGRTAEAPMRRSAEGGKTEEGGIYAPMPGRLVSLKVAVGDSVKAGQVVAILEAMKMENELKAPKSGKVKVINYKPGQNVSQNNPIMIVE